MGQPLYAAEKIIKDKNGLNYILHSNDKGELTKVIELGSGKVYLNEEIESILKKLGVKVSLASDGTISVQELKRENTQTQGLQGIGVPENTMGGIPGSPVGSGVSN